MELQKEYLDMILVPSGLIIMFGYHLLLLYKVLRYPHTTVIGYENHNKRAWVERMLQGAPSDTALALQVISTNISAATYLASLSITLSSLIGTWVGSSSSKAIMNSVIYGDTSASTSSVKYITLLSFFLVAFTSFVQSTRYYLHANFLMSTLDSDIPLSYVQSAVIRGSNFWSLGLRALYFATTLLLWVFGPIPMFICSLSMVMALHFLDSNSTPLHKFQFRSNQGLEKKVGGQKNDVIQLIEMMSIPSSNMS
ncbi:uncharacterized protein LOC143861007 [Tasmannia lanceolata]|uniref:uncharacterized protein LOC143861007 n=1 Tax=Tasmannia lanceolata TaxID=3420 RepID=UPI004063D5D2